MPSDPYGNYTHVPYSAAANETWNLECWPGYYPHNGLTYARCTPDGWVRPAGVCQLVACSNRSIEHLHPNGTTTCLLEMQEGDTCTVLCPAHQKRYGYWTCYKGRFWGQPTCLDKESEFWKVVWTRPVIIGSMDIAGDLGRAVNATNYTIEPFAENITKGLSDTLWRIEPRDFANIDVFHMYEAPGFTLKGYYIDEDGMLVGNPTLWKRHIFKVDYQLIVWDVNAFSKVKQSLEDILVEDSVDRAIFANNLFASMEFYMSEIYINYYPLAYNETLVAPNNGYDDRAHHQAYPNTLIWLVLIAIAGIYSE